MKISKRTVVIIAGILIQALGGLYFAGFISLEWGRMLHLAGTVVLIYGILYPKRKAQ
ncbi:hypothetical protein [Paenibacillus aquistagni]|uniref:hypothetical protein n=1 Tax=Paenibacillus aquistagni TaxID=1852522 RepID=UPI00145A21BF|nr:hypothetical protein [Paenibacillus aquistagni]NMM53092.1 hypothetical protein [Paenibacillus aquistagni]